MGDNCFKWNQGTGLELSCQLAYRVRHFTANSNATWTDFHITRICIQLFSKQVLLMICPLLNQFRKKCSLYSGCHWYKLFPKVWFWQYYDCKSVASVCRLTKVFFKNTNSCLQFSGVVFSKSQSGDVEDSWHFYIWREMGKSPYVSVSSVNKSRPVASNFASSAILQLAVKRQIISLISIFLSLVPHALTNLQVYDFWSPTPI